MPGFLPPKTQPASSPQSRRADAKRNYARIVEIARTVVAEEGTNASLRDIARRAGVGMGTLYRHFPTRDALLEALLRQGFDDLARTGEELERSASALEGLSIWLSQFVDAAARYRGLTASMMATIADTTSALHASCLSMREAAHRLLERAKAAGEIRPDATSDDLFALVSAVAWVADYGPSVGEQRSRLLSIVLDGLSVRHHRSD